MSVLVGVLNTGRSGQYSLVRLCWYVWLKLVSRLKIISLVWLGR